MTPKVESYCKSNASKRQRYISVDAGTRCCFNCIWYEQYFHKYRGSIDYYTPADYGNCLLHDRKRGPLCGACKDFEQEISTHTP